MRNIIQPFTITAVIEVIRYNNWSLVPTYYYNSRAESSIILHEKRKNKLLLFYS